MKPASRLITQGHRGARGVLPENTLVSFEYAMDAGVDRIEVDVNLSADDVLIVVHDETTNPDLVRDADGLWVGARTAWHGLPIGEIRSMDVGRIRPGSRYARRFPAQRSVDGARIPLFGEVAELAARHEHCGINIEIKCDPGAIPPRPQPGRFAEEIIAAIHRYDIATRVTVQSFNWQVVAAVRALDTSLVTGCLSSERPEFDTIGRGRQAASPWTNGLSVANFGGSVPAMVASMGVDYWASDFRDLDRGCIDEARGLGLEVHCWTVNEPGDMKRLISWGVDSIITDFPEELLALARGRAGH